MQIKTRLTRSLGNKVRFQQISFRQILMETALRTNIFPSFTSTACRSIGRILHPPVLGGCRAYEGSMGDLTSKIYPDEEIRLPMLVTLSIKPSTPFPVRI